MNIKDMKDISKLLDDAQLVSKTLKRGLELDPMLLEDPQVKEKLLSYVTEKRYDKLRNLYKKFMEIYNSPHEVK